MLVFPRPPPPLISLPPLYSCSFPHQSDIAALSAVPSNAWIDEDGAASFFELSFRASTIEGTQPTASRGGSGLAGAEVIAAKVYLFAGSGVVLHCVWYRSSIFCVLADAVEDLPLLDVAFPDVTARNRVVQVREYSERTGRKMADAFPGAPLPRALRVWEGRRKGAFAELELEALLGAGGGSSSSDSCGSAAGATAPAAAAPLAAAPAAVAPAAAAPVTMAAAAAPASSDCDGDLYDFGQVKVGGGGRAVGGSGGGVVLTAPAATVNPSASTATPAATAPVGASAHASAFVPASTRAPHRVAPLQGAVGGGGGGEEGRSALSRVIMVGGVGDGGAAPWDASGKPVAR